MDYSTAREFARELRKNQTKAETVFWCAVRNRCFHGYKFNRQFVLEYKLLSIFSKYFIVDFYCHKKKLIVEIDGKYHNYQISADTDREAIIKSYGYSIVRFKNEEILTEWEKVENKLLEFLKKE